ncbi:hypothetical protein B484DRAFT_407694, partial [Ochromonadaceae sp. CCMP2298]
RPSFRPTAAATQQTAPIVSLSLKLTFTGVSTASLTEEGQSAVLDATAASTGIPVNTIFYDGDTSTPNNRRRLTTSWTIISSTRVEIPLSSTSYSTPELLFSSLTSLLDTAMTTGAYSTRLNAAAANVVCAPDDGVEDGQGAAGFQLGLKGGGSAKVYPGRYEEEGEDDEDELPASPLKMPVELPSLRKMRFEDETDAAKNKYNSNKCKVDTWVPKQEERSCVMCEHAS